MVVKVGVVMWEVALVDLEVLKPHIIPEVVVVALVMVVIFKF